MRLYANEASFDLRSVREIQHTAGRIALLLQQHLRSKAAHDSPLAAPSPMQAALARTTCW